MLSSHLRGGYRLTPVNWHLAAGQVRRIINGCYEYQALFAPRAATRRP